MTKNKKAKSTTKVPLMAFSSVVITLKSDELPLYDMVVKLEEPIRIDAFTLNGLDASKLEPKKKGNKNIKNFDIRIVGSFSKRKTKNAR